MQLILCSFFKEAGGRREASKFIRKAIFISYTRGTAREYREVSPQKLEGRIPAAASSKERKSNISIGSLLCELHYLLYKQAMGRVLPEKWYFSFIIKSYFLKITPARYSLCSWSNDTAHFPQKQQQFSVELRPVLLKTCQIFKHCIHHLRMKYLFLINSYCLNGVIM